MFALTRRSVLVITGALLAASGCASAPPPKPPPKPAPPPVEAKPETRPPVLQNSVAPVYPTPAREAGTEGHVVALYRVDETGAVVAILIEESEPKGVFDEAVVDALLQWTFTPALEDGEAAPYKTTQRFPFQLDGAGAPLTAVEIPAELLQATAAVNAAPTAPEAPPSADANEAAVGEVPAAGDGPAADKMNAASEKKVEDEAPAAADE